MSDIEFMADSVWRMKLSLVRRSTNSVYLTLEHLDALFLSVFWIWFSIQAKTTLAAMWCQARFHRFAIGEVDHYIEYFVHISVHLI